jgi:hypothetical protein
MDCPTFFYFLRSRLLLSLYDSEPDMVQRSMTGRSEFFTCFLFHTSSGQLFHQSTWHNLFLELPMRTVDPFIIHKTKANPIIGPTNKYIEVKWCRGPNYEDDKTYHIIVT